MIIPRTIAIIIHSSCNEPHWTVHKNVYAFYSRSHTREWLDKYAYYDYTVTLFDLHFSYSFLYSSLSFFFSLVCVFVLLCFALMGEREKEDRWRRRMMNRCENSCRESGFRGISFLVSSSYFFFYSFFLNCIKVFYVGQRIFRCWCIFHIISIWKSRGNITFESKRVYEKKNFYKIFLLR